MELVRVPTWCFYSGSYLKWFIPTWLPFVEATNEGHLGTNDHRGPGVELQEVGIKSPMDHQDQCWTLDQAHDPNRGMGPGLLNRVESKVINEFRK